MQSQYGASLGGPIRQDRTFFFTNFEQTRRGDSNVITIQPSNVASINARLDAVGFHGPRIDTGLVPGGYDSTNLFGRLDHKFSDEDGLSVTYNLYDIDAVNARTVGGLNALSRGTNLEHSTPISTCTASGMMKFSSPKVAIWGSFCESVVSITKASIRRPKNMRSSGWKQLSRSSGPDFMFTNTCLRQTVLRFRSKAMTTPSSKPPSIRESASSTANLKVCLRSRSSTQL